MGEQPPFAGLGKLYFCRVEDKDKEPVPLGEAVTLKPGMLTYKDDEPKSEYSNKGYSIGFNATTGNPNKELLKMMLDDKHRVDVRIEQKPGRMPRKMKKAMHAFYYRDTKWKRKLHNYLSRLCHTLHNAEMVVTKEQFDRLSVQIKKEI